MGKGEGFLLAGVCHADRKGQDAPGKRSLFRKNENTKSLKKTQSSKASDSEKKTNNQLNNVKSKVQENKLNNVKSKVQEIENNQNKVNEDLNDVKNINKKGPSSSTATVTVTNLNTVTSANNNTNTSNTIINSDAVKTVTSSPTSTTDHHKRQRDPENALIELSLREDTLRESSAGLGVEAPENNDLLNCTSKKRKVETSEDVAVVLDLTKKTTSEIIRAAEETQITDVFKNAKAELPVTFDPATAPS